ncbi:MAG: PDGLE domain-containing protein [Limisphaera sp.]|nr:PDGLE domain-containing protein [Limisphaera sp.]
MHIPDNFLDAKTVGVTSALAAGAVALALREARRQLSPAGVPLLGLSAAFVFAAQMVNFPVLGGTSGHLAGGTLVAVLLGPAAAVVVLTTVLVVQCVLFADGGVTALGANILNLGVVGAVSGWVVYRGVSRWMRGMAGRVAGVAFGAWCSIVLAAVACSLELAWSRTVALSVALPAMVGIHAVIGLAEGLISALVYRAVMQVRPDLGEGTVFTGVGRRADPVWAWGLGVSLVLAVLLAPWASSWPDGLERVAERFGFAERATTAAWAPIPDYELPGIPWSALAVGMAGLVGTAVVFGLAMWLGRTLARTESRRAGGQKPPEASPLV